MIKTLSALFLDRDPKPLSFDVQAIIVSHHSSSTVFVTRNIAWRSTYISQGSNYTLMAYLLMILKPNYSSRTTIHTHHILSILQYEVINWRSHQMAFINQKDRKEIMHDHLKYISTHVSSKTFIFVDTNKLMNGILWILDLVRWLEMEIVVLASVVQKRHLNLI